MVTSRREAPDYNSLVKKRRDEIRTVVEGELPEYHSKLSDLSWGEFLSIRLSGMLLRLRSGRRSLRASYFRPSLPVFVFLGRPLKYQAKLFFMLKEPETKSSEHLQIRK